MVVTISVPVEHARKGIGYETTAYNGRQLLCMSDSFPLLWVNYNTYRVSTEKCMDLFFLWLAYPLKDFWNRGVHFGVEVLPFLVDKRF